MRHHAGRSEDLRLQVALVDFEILKTNIPATAGDDGKLINLTCTGTEPRTSSEA